MTTFNQDLTILKVKWGKCVDARRIRTGRPTHQLNSVIDAGFSQGCLQARKFKLAPCSKRFVWFWFFLYCGTYCGDNRRWPTHQLNFERSNWCGVFTRCLQARRFKLAPRSKKVNVNLGEVRRGKKVPPR